MHIGDNSENWHQWIGLYPFYTSTHAMKRVINQTAMTDIKAAMALETEATVTEFLDQQTTELLKFF